MKAVTKILAGGVVAAALVSAAPASAQYYPQPSPYGYGYGQGGGVIGQVINQVIGGGYGHANNPQYAVSQCTGAVQARLSRSYGGYGGGYGGAYGNPYGYNQQQYGYSPYNNVSAARVLGISRVEPRSNGGLTVRGVATSGMGGYGYNQSQLDLTFRCRVDYRGFITDVDIDRAQRNYGGTNYTPYATPQSPYGNDYSQYGYRRY